MLSSFVLLLPLTLFTFQYGSTQIKAGEVIGAVGSTIYIPIWIYSNPGATYLHTTKTPIYIPIWIYSNWNRC